MRPSSESLYQFAPINDGLLYTETPNFYPGQPLGDLLTLLLQQRWRGEAHFRAACGYVPYSGGGIAFHAMPLILRGTKPLWWPTPGVSYEEALEALLIETPFFKDERDAMRHHDDRWDPAKKECEWVAKNGLRFSIDDIAYIWLGPQSLRKHSAAKMIAQLREFIPEHIPIYLEAPEREPYPSFWVRGNPLDVSDYQRKVRIENRVTFVIYR